MDGMAMFHLTQKLDNVRKNAREWAKRFFWDVFKIKQDVEEGIKRIKTTMVVGDDTEATTLEEEICRRKWKETNLKEEIF